MQIFNNLNEWRSVRSTLAPSVSLGFAPTMGNLHAGHKSLFIRSKNENDYTATTLFVNPTQFNRADDFTHYPRTLEADIELMKDAGVDFCILPTEQEMYPDAINIKFMKMNYALLWRERIVQVILTAF